MRAVCRERVCASSLGPVYLDLSQGGYETLETFTRSKQKEMSSGAFYLGLYPELWHLVVDYAASYIRKPTALTTSGGWSHALCRYMHQETNGAWPLVCDCDTHLVLDLLAEGRQGRAFSSVHGVMPFSV